MAEKSEFTKTVRIDLMPEELESSSPAKPSGGADKLTRVNWSTRNRMTAAAAAQTRSRYQELLQSVYDAALVTTFSGQIVDVNVRAVEFLRHERAALCNITVPDLIEGADESLMQAIAETLEKERFMLIQAYCRRKDGSSFPAEIAVNKLSLDQMRLCFFIRDTTVRHRTEEMLRVEHAAIQGCASGIMIANLEAVLEYVNPAFARMMGVEEDVLIGQDVRDVLGEREGIDELIGQALSDEQTWMAEMQVVNADQQPIVVQISVTASRNAEGVATGLVFSLANITMRQPAAPAIPVDQAQQSDHLQAEIDELRKANEALQTELAALRQSAPTQP